VLEYHPKLIIVGASAYSRDYLYTEFRRIADSVGAILLADISHTSGLIAAKCLNDPFKLCDIVTTTTHKMLRGPRGALIFSRKRYNAAIDFSVFPQNAGGAHYNTISGICTALLQVSTPAFKRYCDTVISNARLLSDTLEAHNFDVVTGGTDNHLLVVNLHNKGISGAKFERIAELCNVSVNKNTIATDRSAISPSAIRIGTPAMTTRGFIAEDIEYTGTILNDICELTMLIQERSVSKKMTDFTNVIPDFAKDIKIIRDKVIFYCRQFDIPKYI
jgi:glycine hydroxymethyltransferase